jgi:CheY-like chemotaxis protein
MRKLLIVEDDQLMCRVYSAWFKLKGYEVETAHDGEEGLDKVTSFQPDLILLDVMMPKKNGFEVLDKLKSDPTTRAIPVIMLTNLSGEKEMNSALARGAARYIVKSEFELEKVAEMMAEVLGD